MSTIPSRHQGVHAMFAYIPFTQRATLLQCHSHACRTFPPECSYILQMTQCLAENFRWRPRPSFARNQRARPSVGVRAGGGAPPVAGLTSGCSSGDILGVGCFDSGCCSCIYASLVSGCVGEALHAGMFCRCKGSVSDVDLLSTNEVCEPCAKIKDSGRLL